MNQVLQAELRDTKTSGQLRGVRESGKVPGVIYGAGIAKPTAIAVEAKELLAILRSHPHAVVDMNVPGLGNQPVMMTDVQRDPMSHKVLHIDFHQIDMNRKIKAPVRLDASGKSPGEQEGGMLQFVMHELEVECYPKDFPDVIHVDVSGLQLGDNLTIADLKLPDSVQAVADAEAVVVSVLAPQKERTADELDALDDEEEENENHRKAAVAVEKD
ncbi:50S ribosomal protein L25 [Cohnella faecalis]|uniref:Large ribosomal subunit protein bL25 n=1 Tax=Cohnella faecalis TaxID=2315694 RepID=A0A398CR42_9BACL|nr:50S ribosomal protein L25 [Cohnella faecalis]RIE01394.1 50S ribosomal protein L25 [Cohnella faecalis]